MDGPGETSIPLEEEKTKRSALNVSFVDEDELENATVGVSRRDASLLRRHSEGNIDPKVERSGSFALSKSISEKILQLGVPNSQKQVDMSSPNYCIRSDLDSTAKTAIVDSHTSYRQDIDEEITQLKFQLVKFQALADSLEHQLKQKDSQNDCLGQQLFLVTDQRNDHSKRLTELETVISHLQDNVRESALERVELQAKLHSLTEENLKLRHATKRYKGECRKLKKDLEYANDDLEGKSMTIQGLKSENDWLKNQLWTGKENGDVDSDDSEKGVAITGMKEFLTTPSSRSRRRKKSTRSKELDDNIIPDKREEIDQITIDAEDLVTLPQTDGEDRTAGYTSLTDFQLRSATESGVDRKKNRKNGNKSEFISRLAERHGVSQTDDSSTQGANLVPRRNKSFKSQHSSSFKTLPLDSSDKKPSFRSTLSSMSLRETEEEQDPKDVANNTWSIWGIFGGTGGTSKVGDQGEDKTKELSDSSHSSEEFIQNRKQNDLSTPGKFKEPKSGVLMPKRFGAA